MHSIADLFLGNVDKKYYMPITALYVVLFLAVFVLLRAMIVSAKKNRMFSAYSSRMLRKISTSYIKRQEDDERIWLEQGEIEKKPFLYNFDRLLDYSRIRNYIPFLTADVVVVLMVLIVLICFFVFISIGEGFLLGIAVGIGLCVLFRAIIRFIADRNYDLIENDLLKFINAADSESHSSDDIITIIDRASMSMCKPLKLALEKCCQEARVTGRITLAMRHLELAIENGEFRKIVRNMEMAQRMDANFSTVIDECRVGLKEHIAAREERKAQMNSGRTSLIMLIGMGLLTFYLIGNIIETDNVFAFLWSFTLGKYVLIFNIFILFLCLIDVLLVKGRK